MFFRPMTRRDIGRVAELRLGLLETLGATGPDEDPSALRRDTRSHLERRMGSGARGGGVATAIVGVARREGVGRLRLRATSGGRGIYEAAGFEGRTVEEMQLVLRD